MVVRSVIVFFFAVFMAGCTQYTRAFTSDDYMRPPQLFAYATAATEFAKPNASSIISTDSTGVIQITPNVVEQVHQENSSTYRNYLQDILIQRSDYLCGKYLDDMFIRIAARQVTLDQLAMAASAVGTFAAGVSQEMNLVATLANGTNATYDKRVLQEQMSHLLINRINTNRETELGVMRSKANKTVSEYPLSNALQDANNYHQRCGFLDGLTSLTTASTKSN